LIFLFSFTPYSLLLFSVYIKVTMTARDGRIFRLENVFLRGGQIKFIVLPDLLKSAPVLKKIQALRAKKLDSDGAPKTAGKSSGMGTNAKKAKRS
jgi:hypothetical protein